MSRYYLNTTLKASDLPVQPSDEDAGDELAKHSTPAPRPAEGTVDGTKDCQVEMLYGFDRVSGMFATVTVDGQMVEDYILGGMGADELIEMAQRYRLAIPEKHAILAALDLPF